MGAAGVAGTVGLTGPPGPTGDPGSTLIDPRGNPNLQPPGTVVNFLSWTRGPTEIPAILLADALPGAFDSNTGVIQRRILLAPGTYTLTSTYSWVFFAGDPTDIRVGLTRTFLNGVPLTDTGGYTVTVVEGVGTSLINLLSALAAASAAQGRTFTTAIEVPDGPSLELRENAAVVNVNPLSTGTLMFADNFLIARVNTGQ
jgi:hypothetical protein